jgi:hypothetical protein
MRRKWFLLLVWLALAFGPGIWGADSERLLVLSVGDCEIVPNGLAGLWLIFGTRRGLLPIGLRSGIITGRWKKN